jgi:hypothetical protein
VRIKQVRTWCCNAEDSLRLYSAVAAASACARDVHETSQFLLYVEAPEALSCVLLFALWTPHFFLRNSVNKHGL